MISRTIRVLLMGGIGSGKTTLAAFLRQRGALTIDADEIGHRVLEEEAFDVVAARWPDAVKGEMIDRSVLAGMVFSDPAQLRELEALTHPHISSRILEAVEAAGAAVVAVEVPVLLRHLGDGWIRVAVTAADDVRLARLVERGLPEEDVRARMALQPDQDRWVEAADLVFDNTGPIELLSEAVDELLERIREVAAERVVPSP